MQARDFGANPLAMLEVERVALGAHFARWPSARMLLTFLVRLGLRSECGCKRCEAERLRAEKRGDCQRREMEDLLRLWLPGWAEVELGPPKAVEPVDLGMMVEERLAGRGA